jgi:hypothetical protein
MTAERSSVMPPGILTIIMLAVILFGITTATESFVLAFHARTRLDAHQGGGLPDREDHGVVPLQRLKHDPEKRVPVFGRIMLQQ